VVEHRQVLGKKMDEITEQHDQLRQNIAEYTTKAGIYSLMRQIDAWEQESIVKINQTAAEYRNQLRNEMNKSTIKATTILESLKKEVEKSRQDDTFIETDLKTWMTKLTELKNDLVPPRNISIVEDYGNALSITKLLVIETLDDIFQNSYGSISIEDNGKVITHGFMPNYGAVRGKGEYSSGCYQFHFKLECLHYSQQAFFGIISKTVLMQSKSSTISTAYGWAGNNNVFLNGVSHEEYNNYQSDMKTNDTFELLINCDRQSILLTNKRTGKTHELKVDTSKCPFPWQLNFCLHYWGDRVRLLST
jgi:hypothetical protein